MIAVDGEEDPNYRFGSLGGAVRKCRADFGVEIEIDPRPIHPEKGNSRTHCVVGRIHYSERPAEPGWLLYIKASITGDEPADVEEYRHEQVEFPQQPTIDQFFSESQFESYRRLGLHELVGWIISGAICPWMIRSPTFPLDGVAASLKERPRTRTLLKTVDELATSCLSVLARKSLRMRPGSGDEQG